MRSLVLGGAVSGRAAARLARRLDHAVTIFDQDPAVLGALRDDRLPVTTGTWTPSLLTGVDLVIASPGFSDSSEPIQDTLEAGIPLWSELEFASRHFGAPLIAVTGTNGKTTVTGLIAEMLTVSGLRAVAAGNIGTPLADVVGEPFDLAVVEASSFQLRFIEKFHPATAVILNVAPDHLDWHGSFEAYLDAKAQIHRNQDGDDLLVYDADDRGAVEAVRNAPSRLLPVSGHRRPEGGAGLDGDQLDLGEVVVPLAGVPVDDPAFLVDLVSAGVVALAHGAGPEAVRQIITTFRPGPHRRTLVGRWEDVVWVDDSKATNPHAAVASASAYPSVILIAGGRNKGLDLSDLMLVPTLKQVITIGEAAGELEAAAGAVRIERAHTIQEAVELADRYAQPGDTVLLAPGCASFDMFRSYADRGDSFARAVRQRKEAR
ncbi:MAG: UDP-N-acetylmuramoyl-L-alanine--D-glutamate ligase [Acidimicrobiia bacterium]|nr:UDP-N-acetylmuramoyl-L-alanine--D-glutamate ligase [Acidimicrobiia bacterium]